MGGRVKKIGSVVKIDPVLLARVEEFVKKEENRLRFANKKQFIDIAVYEYLNSLKNKKSGGKDEKRG